MVAPQIRSVRFCTAQCSTTGRARMKLYFSTTPLLLLLLAACDTVDQSNRQQQDLADLNRTVNRYIEVFSASNVDACIEFYAPNAMSMPNNGEPLVGREAIKGFFASFWSGHTFTIHSMTVEEVRVSGDLAIVRLSFHESWTPVLGGDSTTVNGDWLEVWRRQSDKTWRIAMDMWNFDGASQ